MAFQKQFLGRFAGKPKATAKVKGKAKAAKAKKAIEPPRTLGPWKTSFSCQRKTDVMQLTHVPSRNVLVQIQRAEGTEEHGLRRAANFGDASCRGMALRLCSIDSG